MEGVNETGEKSEVLWKLNKYIIPKRMNGYLCEKLLMGQRENGVLVIGFGYMKAINDLEHR